MLRRACLSRVFSAEDVGKVAKKHLIPLRDRSPGTLVPHPEGTTGVPTFHEEPATERDF